MKNIYLCAVIAVLVLQTANSQTYPWPINAAKVDILTPESVCQAGSCVQLQASYPTFKETTSYSVSSISYAPMFSSEGGTVIPPASDDKWSPLIQLPFSFSFYGNTYDKILVGTNGLITFDISPTVPGGIHIPDGICPYNYTTPIPSSSFPVKNAIYSVYQDVNIFIPADYSIQNVNYYISGQAPNRIFVVNYNELPHFQCNTSAGLQTSQIVLYETSNVIDINIKKRTPCNSFNSGRGLVGLQNQAGTSASVPAGRNTGNWSANLESWRFEPSGTVIPTLLSWSQNETNFSGSNPTLVCVPETASYVVSLTWTPPNAPAVTVTDEILLELQPPLPVADPVDLTACSLDNSAIFNLTSNTAIILNGENPLDYSVSYHFSQEHANYGIAPITGAGNYSGADGQEIYVRIQAIADICHALKSFTLHISAPPGLPAADTEQLFTSGETLASLEIAGTNVQWYAGPEGGDPLPLSTLLIHNTTYFATQISPEGCESAVQARNTMARLGITVYDIEMGVPEWTEANILAFPNPANGLLTVKHNISAQELAVYNLSGQEVIVTKKTQGIESTVDISALSAGMYMLTVRAASGSQTIKLIKQ